MNAKVTHKEDAGNDMGAQGLWIYIFPTEAFFFSSYLPCCLFPQPTALLAMSFVIPSVEATQEVNLKIVSPLFNEDNKTATIKTQTFTCNSHLHIYLTRKPKNMLQVQIQWSSQNYRDLTHYESMRVFPDSSASFVHFHSFASSKAAENGGLINCKARKAMGYLAELPKS